MSRGRTDRGRAFAVAGVVAALTVTLVTPATAQSAFEDVIVVLEHPSSAAAAAAATSDLAGRYGIQVGHRYKHALAGFAGRLPAGRRAALERDPRVRLVESDLSVERAGEVATGIRRAGASANEVLLAAGSAALVDADVAVLDTGIDAAHPALDVVHAIDCSAVADGLRTSCSVGGDRDPIGHGTHVAGTIGARVDGSATVGVAPGARLWSIKVFSDEGAGYLSGVLAGLDHVVEHADTVEVANLSLEVLGSSQALDDAITQASEAGVTVVVAAGNTAVDVAAVAPAGHPDAITVSALADYDGKPGGKASPPAGCSYGPDDGLASFSNFGTGVDLIAPGTCILSTLPGGIYGLASGTSMAAPHVAGAAALLASSGLEVAEIRETLVVAGSTDWDPSSDPDGVQEPLLDVSSFQPGLLAPAFETSRLTTYTTRTGWEAHLAADVTGNGRADLVSYHPSNGSWWVTSSRDDGSFASPRKLTTYQTRTGWEAHLAADVTGNGRADLVSYHPSNGSWWVTSSNKDGSFSSPKRLTTYTTRTGWEAHLAADVTGNGRADLVSYHPSNGSWWVTSSNKDGSFSSPKRLTTYTTRTGWEAHLAAGVTGNGRADLVSYHPSNGSWWVTSSKDDGSFASPRKLTTYSTRTGWEAHLAADVAGNGRADLVSYHPSNGSWWITRKVGG
jgi:subtilisin family serine protease